MDIINWWNNLNPLSNEEKGILKKGLNHILSDRTEYIKQYGGKEEDYFLSDIPTFTEEEKFDILTNEFFNRMPFCNCNHTNKDLSFNISATSFINMLFNRYVDEDTLVISSDNEHPSVKNKLSECKNVLILSHYDIIRRYNLDYIINASKQYKKVFVYIIGTRNDTGEITPQNFFIDLKKEFIKNSIEHTLVLDDVQGMFVVPRDYTIFDYVIGTGHAMITNFDLGILISNHYIGGYKAYNWGKWYLERLDILLKRKDKMNMFSQVLEQYFSRDILKESRCLAQPLSSPAIFYMKLEDKELDKDISVLLGNINLLVPDSSVSINTFIRLRSHWFLIDNTLLPKCIKAVKYIFEHNKLDKKELEDIIC